VSGNVAVLEVSSAADVLLYNLEITAQFSEASSIAIHCQDTGSPSSLRLEQVEIRDLGTAILSRSCDVSMYDSLIEDNEGLAIDMQDGDLAVHRSTLKNNTEGGISLTDGAVDIVNNEIYRNGFATAEGGSVVGGISLQGATAAQFGVEFNTIAFNVSANEFLASGIVCAAGAARAANNIIIEGTPPEGATSNLALGCTFGFNLSDDSISGDTNIQGDPLFVSPSNFSLQAGSPAIDAADPASTLDVDHSGQPRSGALDIGAHEYSP
jgi:hypothetical protein